MRAMALRHAASCAPRALVACGGAARPLGGVGRGGDIALKMSHRCTSSASASASSVSHLVATRTSNVGKLAGAIAGRIRNNEASVISAIGPLASYMAMKAVVIANKYVQEVNSGKSLAVVPEKTRVDGGQPEMAETVGMLLEVCSVPDPSQVDQPEIFAAGKTNVGHMAGLMANILDRENTVTVGGMGAEAISSALKATIIAQRYLDKLGPGGRLALVPRFDQFEEKSEERMRMLLICTRKSPDAADAAGSGVKGGNG